MTIDDLFFFFLKRLQLIGCQQLLFHTTSILNGVLGHVIALIKVSPWLFSIPFKYEIFRPIWILRKYNSLCPPPPFFVFKSLSTHLSPPWVLPSQRGTLWKAQEQPTMNAGALGIKPWPPPLCAPPLPPSRITEPAVHPWRPMSLQAHCLWGEVRHLSARVPHTRGRWMQVRQQCMSQPICLLAHRPTCGEAGKEMVMNWAIIRRQTGPSITFIKWEPLWWIIWVMNCGVIKMPGSNCRATAFLRSADSPRPLVWATVIWPS